MKTIELFSGIGGFRLACDSLGVETVWANDKASKPSKVYRDNFGENEHKEGDLSLYLDQIPVHNLLTAGFPCQPFSSAGKKLGIQDARGTLFELIIKILLKNRPEYFVLENVKRLLSMDKGAHFATILHALASLDYTVEWRLLNAVNFGLPQNRERIVIIGKLGASPRSYLCTDNDLSTLPEHQLSHIAHPSRWKKVEDHSSKFFDWGLAFNGKFCHAKVESFSEKKSFRNVESILEYSPDEKFFFTEDTRERIKQSVKVGRFFNGVEILYNQKGGARMGYSIFGVAGVAPTLTCTTSRHYERYKIGDEFRRLTNVEYARIQGFPDTHCEVASIYDQYALYGNAIPPQLARWAIARTLGDDFVEITNISRQPTLL